MPNPWEEPLTPEEFEEYYENKLESMQRACKWDECNKVAEFPRDYCSNSCRNKELRRISKEFHKMIEEKT